MRIESFFDPCTFSLSYVVFDEKSRDAVVIDPVLDYDLDSEKVSTHSVSKIVEFIEKEALHLHFIFETHAHADHLAADSYLQKHFGAPLCIGAAIKNVQKLCVEAFSLGPDFATDGSQFDRLISDGEVLQAGTLTITALATPGHTPGCMSYGIEDAIFVGDALFIEDYGTGRCDFPGGDAEKLYSSVAERLYKLPPATRVFICHDYMPDGRKLRCETTIAASMQHNVHLQEKTPREAFVAFRRARDATLSPPRLYYPSVTWNITAGRLPAPMKAVLKKG